MSAEEYLASRLVFKKRSVLASGDLVGAGQDVVTMDFTTDSPIPVVFE